MRRYGLFVKLPQRLEATIKNGSGPTVRCSILTPRYPWIDDTIPSIGPSWIDGCHVQSVYQTRAEYVRLYPDMSYAKPVAVRVFQSALLAGSAQGKAMYLRPVQD